MTTRRVDLLIRKIRRETGNEDYGPNAGIPDTQIVEYLNDAVHFLSRGITALHAKQFNAETFLDLVPGVEKYALPSNFLETGGVIAVHFSSTPTATQPNWMPLEEVTDLERSSGTRSDSPSRYMVMGRELWIGPIPSVARVGCLRVVYTKQLTRFDVRRGTVSAVTLNTGAKTITSLAITPATATVPDEYCENEYISVVDADGNPKMSGIKLPANAYNSVTGVITIRSGFVYATGETIAVGDYVVFGRDNSTHQLSFNETVESFLVSYASWKVLREDSNSNSGEQLTEFKGMRDDIMAAYAKPNQGIQLIPEAY